MANASGVSERHNFAHAALVGQGNRPFVPRIADEGEITRLAINYGIHDNLIE
ncbi:MAG: hypothetical protein IJI71_08420 [Clostridia bacterium]|nr:hypothetical protein [Clostridia bacterium]